MKTKTVLVTGASGGIGLELVRLFAEDGYNLVLVSRDRSKLEAVASQCSNDFGVKAKVIDADLGKPNAAKKVVDQLNADGVIVDVLVNNAGFGLYGEFSETSWEKEQTMIQLNMVALTEFTKLLLPAMLEKKSGRILNVASTAAFQPGPLMAVYYATKAYVLSFTEALAEELNHSGVTVTALCPGPTRSGFQKGAEMERSKLVQGKIDDASSVAKQGYDGLMSGKRVVITGLRNKILAQSIRFIPRSMATKAVLSAQKRVH